MEKDYKKLYLEAKAHALRLEMQLLNMRAQMIGNEMPGVEEELKKHVGKEKNKT